ncbi:MAG: N-acetyltransferase [Algicola sp.]|nr:N-acetyltransferase [Algicola sp.]
MIADTAIIHPNVVLGENVTIEDYCIIGSPFKGCDGAKTLIGDNAVIRAHTIIYAGNKIGNNFQTGNKANIRELNDIGDDVSIGTLSIIEHHVKIGDGVRIHSQVFIPEFSELKTDAWIGPNVVFTNAKYPRSPDVKDKLVGPTIGVNAKVGANSTLLPGVVIGDNALIGAGSLVSKDVPDNSVAVGHPAKVVKQVSY